jgi:hypothetical protein
MRIHALEATGGLTYAQMGRFMAKPGTPAKFTDGHGATSDEQYALVDPKTKQPVDNGARNLWVTETALTTALNSSYMAERVSLFGIAMGAALLLAESASGSSRSEARWRASRRSAWAARRPKAELPPAHKAPPVATARAASGRPFAYSGRSSSRPRSSA